MPVKPDIFAESVMTAAATKLYKDGFHPRTKSAEITAQVANLQRFAGKQQTLSDGQRLALQVLLSEYHAKQPGDGMELLHLAADLRSTVHEKQRTPDAQPRDWFIGHYVCRNPKRWLGHNTKDQEILQEQFDEETELHVLQEAERQHCSPDILTNYFARCVTLLCGNADSCRELLKQIRLEGRSREIMALTLLAGKHFPYPDAAEALRSSIAALHSQPALALRLIQAMAAIIERQFLELDALTARSLPGTEHRIQEQGELIGHLQQLLADQRRFAQRLPYPSWEADRAQAFALLSAAAVLWKAGLEDEARSQLKSALSFASPQVQILADPKIRTLWDFLHPGEDFPADHPPHM